MFYDFSKTRASPGREYTAATATWATSSGPTAYFDFEEAVKWERDEGERQIEHMEKWSIQTREKQLNLKLTAATSEKYWYKSIMSRDHAVQILKGAEPGDFIVRDSKSFQGSYGLCVRVERHQVNACCKKRRQFQFAETKFVIDV